MILEKYPYIDTILARELIDIAKEKQFDKRGFDRRAFLLGDYVVLKTDRMKLRNAVIQDDELIYFNEIIEMLKMLHDSGVGTTPILGYCCDSDSADGVGYMIQMRAKGCEVYDDAIMARYQVWAQNQSAEVYLSSSLNAEEAAEYVLNRTLEIAGVPQNHYDQFIRDMITILEKDLLIDFNGQSNFFYDPQIGFQFIDIDSHNDFRYGLSMVRMDIEKIVARGGFVLCHRANGLSALDEKAALTIGKDRLNAVKRANKEIAEKCRCAMMKNGIAERLILCEMENLYF